MFKGWKTVLTGLGVAIAPVAVTYLAGIDWTQYVSPTWAVSAIGVLMLLLRSVTNTTLGTKI